MLKGLTEKGSFADSHVTILGKPHTLRTREEIVTEWKDLDNPELQKIIRKNILRGLIFLAALVALIFIIALIFDEQLEEMANTLIKNFGILGLGAVVFFADLIISPIPPDAALFFIGKSHLHDSWALYVPILGIISTTSGVCGWFIGQKLKHISYFKKIINYYGDSEHKSAAKKFGFWMVVLGALTPLPFSLTCWLAGIFRMPFKNFLIAASFRIPRFVIYYWAIFYSGAIGSFIRTLL